VKFSTAEGLKIKNVLHICWCLDSERITVCIHSASLGQVYEQHQDEDGFLYVAYSSETTFGWQAANDHVHAYICWIWTSAALSDKDTYGCVYIVCITQGVGYTEYVL